MMTTMRFPDELADQIREIHPNINVSAYVRDAVKEKLEREKTKRKDSNKRMEGIE